MPAHPRPLRAADGDRLLAAVRVQLAGKRAGRAQSGAVAGLHAGRGTRVIALQPGPA